MYKFIDIMKLKTNSIRFPIGGEYNYVRLYYFAHRKSSANWI